MEKTSPLQILPIDAEILSVPTEKVTVFDESLKKELEDMFETMLSAGGVGLSANQVGLSKSMFVMVTNDGERLNIVNPELVSKSDSIYRVEEGCLSLPGAFADTNVRSEVVVVKYQDVNGANKIASFSEFDAVCVQHEMEHLSGQNFLMHMNRSIRRRFLKKYL